MFLTLCLIFKSFGIISLIYLNFHISAFWLEIAYFGPKFEGFGLIVVKSKN